MASLERGQHVLQRRGVSRWVYVNGLPGSDQTGIDAPTWTDSDLPGQSFTWQNGWAEGGVDDPQQDGLTRYRIGPSGFEMVINAGGGATGTVMFTLITDYWNYLDGKQTFTATDDAGNFTCYTIVPRTDKQTCADVYAGRV